MCTDRKVYLFSFRSILQRDCRHIAQIDRTYPALDIRRVHIYIDVSLLLCDSCAPGKGSITNSNAITLASRRFSIVVHH